MNHVREDARLKGARVMTRAVVAALKMGDIDDAALLGRALWMELEDYARWARRAKSVSANAL